MFSEVRLFFQPLKNKHLKRIPMPKRHIWKGLFCFHYPVGSDAISTQIVSDGVEFRNPAELVSVGNPQVWWPSGVDSKKGGGGGRGSFPKLERRSFPFQCQNIKLHCKLHPLWERHGLPPVMAIPLQVRFCTLFSRYKYKPTFHSVYFPQNEQKKQIACQPLCLFED